MEGLEFLRDKDISLFSEEMALQVPACLAEINTSLDSSMHFQQCPSSSPPCNWPSVLAASMDTGGRWAKEQHRNWPFVRWAARVYAQLLLEHKNPEDRETLYLCPQFSPRSILQLRISSEPDLTAWSVKQNPTSKYIKSFHRLWWFCYKWNEHITPRVFFRLALIPVWLSEGNFLCDPQCLSPCLP